MLKILLVEDEYVVREGIKSIDWASTDFEFVGDASDGEMALPMIRSLRPDIVITDIKMPFMDGLELSKRIKKELPDTEIVILSGYEEFEYAKEAIALGVAKYLSKPISSGELIKELTGLSDQIEQKKADREIARRYELDMAEDLERKRSAFFRRMISRVSVAELLEEADELDINLEGSAYCVVLCCAYYRDETDPDCPVVSEAMYKRLGEWAISYKDEFQLFSRDLEGQAIVFKGEDPEILKEHIHRYSDEFASIMEEFGNIRYYAGVGCVVTRLSELGKSFEVAQRLYAHRYFDEDNNILYHAPGQSAGSIMTDPYHDSEKDPGIEFSHIDTKNLETGRLVSFLRTGTGDETEYFLDEVFDKVGVKALESQMFRQYITMNIYFVTVDFLSGIDIDRDEIKAPDPELNIARSQEEMRAYCVNILKRAIDLRNTKSQGRYRDVLDRVENYVREHYMDEDLGLNTLAELVGFSPNHLSSVYSAERDRTLNRFIIDYRLDKAKEALRCTPQKSSEIAVSVGYKDPHYFSYTFKKLTGMTPTQYRESVND